MPNIIEIEISGMTCNHCVARATKALQAVPGVELVDVTLEPGGATVQGAAGPNALTDAVKEAGYGAVVRS